MRRTQVKSALVVSGGAMRGIFASGVLDTLLEQECPPFDLALGVSAGTLNLLGYLAGDHGRSYRILTGHARQPEFLNFGRYLRGGHFMDVHWLWHSTKTEVQLNLDQFAHQPTPLYAVTTSVSTGAAHYHRVTGANMDALCPATCAVPLIYRDYPELGGLAMADGGIADPIPVREAYRRGARDITAILCRPLAYREPDNPAPWLVRKVFRDYPALAEAIVRSADAYRAALAFLRHPPADCRVRLIAPPGNFTVRSFTRDLDRLNAGYQQGKDAGLALCPQALRPARARRGWPWLSAA